MMLLAVDTSTTSCSVALFSGERLLAEETYAAGTTHSRHLMSIIHRILGGCRCDSGSIDAIAVTRGPGTFTGLRIGISTVKGLALATQASVVGISSLAALAFPFALHDRPVVAMIDARRGEVYYARYRRYAGGAGETAVTASVGPPEAAAADVPEDAVLVGSGAVLYRRVFADRCPNVRFADPIQHVIRAASVGRLAMPRLSRGSVDSIDRLVPEYIRKSDAQIQRNQLSATC